MIRLIRSDTKHLDFAKLVARLDAYLTETDGEEHGFYDQYNQLDSIKYVILAYWKEKPVGCGAIKEYDKQTMEIKRMYTLPESRQSGIATKIITELENWASELGYSRCILEVGKRQPEAIRFYQKNDYQVIPNYGQYKLMENSLCFEKLLN